MYLVGSPHKTDSHVILERLTASGERLVTDAEVLQEILHRYWAVGRRDAIGPAFRAILTIVDEVLPIERRDVLRAAEITQSQSQLSVRDAVHIAVMEHHGIPSILSFDCDFDHWPGIHRTH
jgi:predicted nucleic acid-binding protein